MMAITRTESSIKLVISLFLVLCNIKYCTLKVQVLSEQLLLPTAIQQQKDISRTIHKENVAHGNVKDSSVETEEKFSIQLEISHSQGEKSSCYLMPVNYLFTLILEENNCNIMVDKFDVNSMKILNHLNTFCKRDKNFDLAMNTRNIGFNESNECEVKRQIGERYIIVTKYSKNISENDVLIKICKHLNHINEENIQDIENSICIFISDHYLQYHNKKCCIGSFDFIPKSALQIEMIMLWIQKDGSSYFIGTFYCVSFICLCIIFLSCIVSRTYRSERGNLILIHFAFSIFVQFILHVFSCLMIVSPFSCYLQSIAFHYFSLVESCWTSIIAYLQYRRFVKVFDNEPNHFILKLCSIAYILPIIPIFVWILYHRSNTELANYLTFGLPEFLILLINSTLLILIIKNLVFGKNKYIKHRKSLSMEVKLIFFLFFILDFSWFHIILADITSKKIFIYLFLFTQSSQGFMLFFVFGIMNEQNRLIYRKFLYEYSRGFLRIK
ncbi:adhesion G-protein coupled receptor D1-like [Harmonia axyridis]|uniref:adhesion G-protein coupled receptor D1-like n=1 Tax=Harmonia axyridis TaxID=115357 RepID=UPI001E278C45|nr:adhesion G-protein coupled receptor D1-like [Harmonia axyridis]